jgi:hypothetical protein
MRAVRSCLVVMDQNRALIVCFGASSCAQGYPAPEGAMQGAPQMSTEPLLPPISSD